MKRLVRIDTNLLVLLVVGLVSPEIIARHKHKRLKKYYPADFALLCETIGDRRLCLLPNVATETHNILGLHGEPERRDLLDQLGAVVMNSVENYVPNKEAVTSPLYARLGLADTALFLSGAPEILTDDFGLYRAAAAEGQQATMFTHLRIKARIIVPQ